MRKVAFALTLAALLAASACGGSDDEDENENEAAATDGCDQVDLPDPKPEGKRKPPTQPLEEGTTYRVVVETNCGSFTIELDQKSAPKTTASMVALARDGFYDDTIIHRVVPAFVIQGGDPTGTGRGGPGYQTIDRPPQNAEYTRGVVAMAKSGSDPPGAAGSQFFVVTAVDSGLPPEYAIVGKISEGLETIEKIDHLGNAQTEKPSQTVLIRRMRVETD
jgi:cyclophilin family peptidyl-prolyl cis-trans isomerase